MRYCKCGRKLDDLEGKRCPSCRSKFHSKIKKSILVTTVLLIVYIIRHLGG